jgi:TDG/mug DNA glycosylase family protein
MCGSWLPSPVATPLKSSFAAIVDVNTRVVVLGSLPGDMSLEYKQYYARPTNQFWRLMSAVLDRDFVNLPYDERLAELLAARIGLWDVIQSAKRMGSGDGAIRDYTANVLQEFANSLPYLKALAFNGGKTAIIGRKQLIVPHSHAILALPSSSAAYCSISLQQKLEAWLAIRDYL